MAILAILWEQQGRPTDGWIFPVRKVTAVGTGYKQWDVGPIRTDPIRHTNPCNWYRRKYHPAVLAAGLQNGITFHPLRHTWASLMGPHTLSRILQILGGRGDLKLVERYCQPSEEAMRNAMEQARSCGNKVSWGFRTPTGKLRNIPKTKT
ncbi:MAG: hypothetical protein KGS09_08065 [Nitrospirae bacterium]|nr:hypothetical protein [Nitrospirota bacterium]MDE3043093.1 hypothetical protein [Nitrospirota bacterium]MDE3221798.1 hypothetical protein [Nitrospirota bacterium]